MHIFFMHFHASSHHFLYFVGDCHEAGVRVLDSSVKGRQTWPAYCENKAILASVDVVSAISKVSDKVDTLIGSLSGEWIGTIVETQLSQGLFELKNMHGVGHRVYGKLDEENRCDFISTDYAVKMKEVADIHGLFQGLEKCDF